MFIIWRNKKTNNTFTTNVFIPEGTPDAKAYTESHAKALYASGGIYANSDFQIDTESKSDADLRNSNQLYKKQRARDDISASIATLEISVTPRRIREAALGTDKGWLSDIDKKISVFRKQLKDAK